MWKLTITQKRKSDYSEGMIDYSVEFFSAELSELTMLIERITHCNSECETEYKLERVFERMGVE